MGIVIVTHCVSNIVIVFVLVSPVQTFIVASNIYIWVMASVYTVCPMKVGALIRKTQVPESIILR